MMTLLREPRVGTVAARALVTELDRHAGPKTGLLVDVTAGSPVFTAAIDGLLPDDRLTVVARDAASATALRTHIQSLGRSVAERVNVPEGADAVTADVIVVAEPVTGSAEEARARIEELVKLLAPGGVLSVATPAIPDTGLGDSAPAELGRQSVLFGVGSDLVLRNLPPLRVHRLRFSAAEAAAAERMAPAYRPSSVPLTSAMHIDSNGVVAGGIALGLAGFLRLTRPKSPLWLVPAVAAVPVAAFFRDPRRDVPADEATVVAASDGKVLSVERVVDERFGTGEPFLRVAVFLSVFDVHVNRAPVAGKVVDYFVTDGGCSAAMTPAAEHNVAAYTVLETVRGTVVVAQRTGLVARRIVQRAPVGALLARGERFGLIRFGSRTDVYLPATAAEATVAPGDKVRGGSSVIARWR